MDIEGSGLTKVVLNIKKEMFMSHSCAMKCLQAVTYQLTVPKLDDRRPSKIYKQVKRGKESAQSLANSSPINKK